MKSGFVLRVIAILVAMILVLPTVIICSTAFTSGESVSFPPEGFSTRWIQKVLQTPMWVAAFGNSMLVGLLAAVFAMIAGSALALGASRVSGRMATFFTALAVLPMIVPLVVGAVGFYLVYSRVGLTGNALGLGLAHGVLGLPYVFVNVLATLKTLNPQLEEAARVHGATQSMALATITLPLVAQATLIGGLLSFISSWDEAVVATFLSNVRFQTLPVQMYAQIRSGVQPSVSAVALIVTVVTFVLVLLVFAAGALRTRLQKRTNPA